MQPTPVESMFDSSDFLSAGQRALSQLESSDWTDVEARQVLTWLTGMDVAALAEDPMRDRTFWLGELTSSVNLLERDGLTVDLLVQGPEFTVQLLLEDETRPVVGFVRVRLADSALLSKCKEDVAAFQAQYGKSLAPSRNVMTVMASRVRPDLRRKGFGRLLYAVAIREAGRRGAMLLANACEADGSTSDAALSLWTPGRFAAFGGIVQRGLVAYAPPRSPRSPARTERLPVKKTPAVRDPGKNPQPGDVLVRAEEGYHGWDAVEMSWSRARLPTSSSSSGRLPVKEDDVYAFIEDSSELGTGRAYRAQVPWQDPNDEDAAYAEIVEFTPEHFPELAALAESYGLVGARVLDRGPVGLLRGVEVTDGARGQGIGRRMVERVLELARADRLHAVYVAAEPRPVTFYQRLGFQPLVGPAGNGRVTWMRLDLLSSEGRGSGRSVHERLPITSVAPAASTPSELARQVVAHSAEAIEKTDPVTARRIREALTRPDREAGHMLKMDIYLNASEKQRGYAAKRAFQRYGGPWDALSFAATALWGGAYRPCLDGAAHRGREKMRSSEQKRATLRSFAAELVPGSLR